VVAGMKFFGYVHSWETIEGSLLEVLRNESASKSLIIHKTPQNNRNHIILWCIWVYLGVFGYI
jgi:hypothetical protein